MQSLQVREKCCLCNTWAKHKKEKRMRNKVKKKRTRTLSHFERSSCEVHTCHHHFCGEERVTASMDLTIILHCKETWCNMLLHDVLLAPCHSTSPSSFPFHSLNSSTNMSHLSCVSLQLMRSDCVSFSPKYTSVSCGKCNKVTCLRTERERERDLQKQLKQVQEEEKRGTMASKKEREEGNVSNDS